MPRDSNDIKAQLRAQIAEIENATFPSPSDKGALSATPKDGAASLACPDPCKHQSSSLQATNDVFAAEQSTETIRHALDPEEQQEQERAFRKIERLSLMREQASEELRVRLLREGYSPQATEAALIRAQNCGLVSDERYAEVLVRSRLSQGRGSRGIEAELKKLHIDISCVRGWPEEFAVEGDDELARALALLDKKPPRAKNKRDAAYRRLVLKGFGSSIASTAARLWTESNPD